MSVRSPEDHTLGWVEQRHMWNSEGYCAVAACGQPHDHHVYKDHNALKYCTRHAQRLVEAQGDVIEWDRTPRRVHAEMATAASTMNTVTLAAASMGSTWPYPPSPDDASWFARERKKRRGQRKS